jgi:hypothetical protein
MIIKNYILEMSKLGLVEWFKKKEHLTSKHEALSLNPNTTKNKHK